MTVRSCSTKKSSSLASAGGRKRMRDKVEAEAVDGAHAERAVLAGVVLVFDPRRESAVERLDAR